MPDIFGREPRDYAHYAAVIKHGGQESFTAALEQRRRTVAPETNAEYPRHNFNALGSYHTAAADDAQVWGFVRDNMTAFDSVVQDVLYRMYRFEDYLPVKSDIPAGSKAYAKQIADGQGEGRFIDDAGSEIPNVTDGLITETYPIYHAALGANYTTRDVRAAMVQGKPLEARKMELMAKGCVQHMTKIALSGDTTRKLSGVFNQLNHASNVELVRRSAAAKKISAMTADEIYQFLQSQVSGIYTDSKTIFGSEIQSELCIFLPPAQYARVLETPRSVDNDRTVWNFFASNNIWTYETGSQPRLISMPQLTGAANNGTDDRMVMLVKDNSVLEIPVPMRPTMVPPYRQGLVFKHTAEYEIGGVNVYRPMGLRYVDTV